MAKDNPLDMALELRAHLLAGGSPQPVQTSVRLREGETCHWQGHARLLAFEGADVGYTTIKGSGGLIATAASAVIWSPFNVASKANAARRAAAKWRPAGSADIHVTSGRIVLAQQHSYVDWGYDGLAQLDLYEDLGVYLAWHNAQAQILDIGLQGSPWLYVMLSFLAFGERNVGLPGHPPIFRN